ncbi:serine hydrolase domain-containing protein [Catenuloplanes japonicus]|uniref:serine hydrolase domain-containing protein n=1 Tax=Catenuloplanes japonicus TaxID=33876 RepID=UPI00068B6DB3|nr:serine hydrolase domain-containing protein [Catenuloplanes japonicus]
MTTHTRNTTKSRIGTAGRTALSVGLAAALLASGTAASAGHSPMREVVRYSLEVGAPGVMARIDDGRRTTVTAAGVADRSTGRPLTGREQFEIGSNTKTFTAVLALQLVDQGRLDLDAPVERYLPGIVPNGAHITVRMLLNHSSGLYGYTDGDFFAAYFRDPQHVHTDAELLAYAFAHEPYAAPGAGWFYSNTNYVLAGMIVQKLTGERMPELVARRITGPLGLRHTYYADPRATGTAHGYTIDYATTPWSYIDTTGWPLAWAGAAGAIVSNQEDLSRFFAALLGGELISSRQLAQMKTTVPIPENPSISGAYGLGLMHKNTACGWVWGHGGDTNGHHSTAVVTGDGRRTVVSDTTISPTGENADRYYEVMIAAETVTVCEMLGKPVPTEVLEKLRG